MSGLCRSQEILYAHPPLLPPQTVFLSLANTVNNDLGKAHLSEVRAPWCFNIARLPVQTDNFTWLWSSFLLGHGWKGEDRKTGGVETADAYFIKVLWTLHSLLREGSRRGERWAVVWPHIRAFCLFQYTHY